MKMFRASLLALACLATPLAFAQWQWIDASGRKVFSDQPPPPGTPSDKILKRPGNRPAEPEPASPASAAAPAQTAPRVTGRDKELEEKKKAAVSAEAEKRHSQEQESANLKTENCQRAKEAKRTLESGVRLSQANSKGEREVMDDASRAAESRRLESVIARDCPH